MSVIHQLEGPQRVPGGNVFQVLITGGLGPEAAAAARNGDVLLAVQLPGDRLAGNAGRRLELPKGFPGLRINRNELTGLFTGENHRAGGDQGSCPIGALPWQLPFDIAGYRIDGLQITAGIRIVPTAKGRPECSHFCK